MVVGFNARHFDMTVQDLIDMLQQFDKDASVKFEINVSCNAYYILENGIDEVVHNIDDETQELSVDVDFEEEAELVSVDYDADDNVVVALKFDGTI